jgi:hypothetical protein
LSSRSQGSDELWVGMTIETSGFDAKRKRTPTHTPELLRRATEAFVRDDRR